MDDGQLSIRWTGGDLLPQDLVNVPTVNPRIYSWMDDEYLELENLDGIVFSEHQASAALYVNIIIVDFTQGITVKCTHHMSDAHFG